MRIAHTHRERIVEVCNLCVGWLNTLDQLLPTEDCDLRAAWNVPSVHAVEDKIVAECATFLYVATRTAESNPWPELSAATENLTDALARVARPRWHLEMLQGNPHLVWPIAMSHAILNRLGVTDSAYDACVRQCVELGWNTTVDRLLFRTLETRWIQAVWSDRQPDVDTILAVAPIGPPSIVARREDVYAFTHMLFYVTDFGHNRLPECLDRGVLAEQLDAYLAWQLWENDLDTTGELLSAAYLCDVPSLYSEIVLALLWPELQHGLSRGPALPCSLDSSIESDPMRHFSACYHTTLVSGILAASIALSGFDPDGPQSSGSPVESSYSAVLQILGIAGAANGWNTRVSGIFASQSVSNALMFDGATSFAYHRNAFDTSKSLSTNSQQLNVSTPTLRHVGEALRFGEAVGS